MATASGLTRRSVAVATAAASAEPTPPATMQVLSVRATQLLMELEGLLRPSPTGLGVKVKGLSESLEAQRAKFEEVLMVIMQMEQRSAMERDRLTWEAKIAQHKSKLKALQKEHIRLQRIRQQDQHTQQQRIALLGPGDGKDMFGRINDAAKENDSLSRTANGLDTAIDMAAMSLGSLKEQGASLKASSFTLDNIAQTLGISDSLIRVIKRREWGDSMVVYAGMAFTIVFLYLFWKLVRG